MLPKIWFFDLEETIIKSWDDPVLCNVERVKEFIAENQIKEVHIFSAAIWNENDCAFFRDNFKNWLAGVFGVDILTWVSMTTVWKQTTWKAVRFDDVNEMLGLIGKKRMFEDWCKQTICKDAHCILLDDSFGNETLIDHDHNLVIEVIDVATI